MRAGRASPCPKPSWTAASVCCVFCGITTDAGVGLGSGLCCSAVSGTAVACSLLPQLPSGGQTLIEKLEHYQQDAAFGVVLATPDDEGYKRGEPGKKLFRARQNVVLEYGMLLASPSLGRHRVALLLKDPADLEPPSDIKGLIYIPFRESVEDVRTELAKEMKHQGIVVALEDV